MEDAWRDRFRGVPMNGSEVCGAGEEFGHEWPVAEG